MWVLNRRNFSEGSTVQRLWDYSALLVYLLYQFGFFLAAMTGQLLFDLPPASGVAYLMEMTRFMMKLHAFVRSNAPKALSSNNNDPGFDANYAETYCGLPPFSKYVYFLFVPTLVYRDEYPRTRQTRWGVVIFHGFEIVLAVFFFSFILERMLAPLYENFGTAPISSGRFVESLFRSIIPGTLFSLCFFYCSLHSCMNVAAELMRFADRMFYRDWWNESTFPRYIRSWNVVVHDWLYTYLYRDALEYVFCNYKPLATIAVFTVSAVFHEIILAFSFKFFYPIMFVQFEIFGLMMMFVTKASTLSKVEILQRAIELIGKLQKKIKVLVEECNDPLKEHVKEQEQRLKRLLVRNEELAGLLRKAKINVPPCKYTIAEDEIQRQNEEKENGNQERKPAPKQRRAGTAPKKQPVIDKQPPASVASSESLELSVVKCTPSKASGVNIAVSNCSSCNNLATAPGPPTLRHSNGIGPGNGVNVTPALHPTPIMTTSVIISNNGNLVQVPIVAPPSSLLIVGNEDVRSRINLKNRAPDDSPARYRGKRGKFTIKSIDLIPGRIVNGKIPIPPLRRSTIDSLKAPRLKRKRLIEKCKRLRKPNTPTINIPRQHKTHDTSAAKRARLHEVRKTANEGLAKAGETHEKQIEQVLETSPQKPCTLVQPAIDKSPPKEQQKNAQSNVNEPAHRETHLDISLNQTELPEDIFANLHVGPDGSNVHGNNDDGTLSPTAAYLMNFPIVAGGGKAAGNHADTGEGDECHDPAPIENQPSKSNIASSNEQTNGMILDTFSSYFNYGHIDTMGVASAPTVGHDASTVHSIPASGSTAATSTSSSLITATGSSTKENSFINFPTIYQSIDNMLDNRPAATTRSTTVGAANRSLSTDTEFPGSVTFTFTLTSNTCTAPTTAQSAIGSAHFYGSSCAALNPVKAVDEFSSPLKPSIEFTFSLTSTTASQPRTVQSQYTNSTMLATTMTTPSYETYGYFHKNVSKPSTYCASFNVLDPLLATEKPATSFTFSLTSSTKTEPAYAQSTIVTVSSTNTTQTYGTPPKLSTKQYHQPGMDSFPPKQTPAPKPDKISQRPNKGNAVHGSLANGMHHPQQQQQQLNASSQQQPASQHQAQSKYDVTWMAAGVHNGQSTISSHNNQQQQPQLSSYEPVPSLEFTTTVGYAGTSNYKSDIFFAHPPGEEHNLTWSSPSKLSNILNDSSSPYFPPVTLPTLNGDLALNTSGGVNSFGGVSAGTSNKSTAVTSCKIATNHTKKSYTHASTVGTVPSEATSSGSFLSVSQLVNEPSKSYPSNTNSNVAAMSASSNSGVCQQKPTNNNYSAEALIGNSYTTHSSYSSVGLENGRKDKMFDYGAPGTVDSASSTAGPLILNFDSFGNSSGMDYNKGYNFGNQQNGYITTSYGEAGYNGTGNCGLPNSASTSSIPYYGKASVSQAYYNQSNSEGSILDTGSSSTAANYTNTSHSQTIGTGGTLGQDYAPYYLPSFGEKKHYSTPTHCGSSEQTSSKTKVDKDKDKDSAGCFTLPMFN
uniref:Sterol O-acyltransferase 2 n=1 Tax=Anopheles culicifacies TaxID=139723 RepID=A0A182M1Y7_9DIPT